MVGSGMMVMCPSVQMSHLLARWDRRTAGGQRLHRASTARRDNSGSSAQTPPPILQHASTSLHHGAPDGATLAPARVAGALES
jgi:hypothetical protein